MDVEEGAPVYDVTCINSREIKMAKRPLSDGAGWSAGELKRLQKLARTETAAVAAEALGRTPAAVQQKAMRSGISFRKNARRTVRKKK